MKLLLSLCLIAHFSLIRGEITSPHIIVILADDLGKKYILLRRAVETSGFWLDQQKNALYFFVPMDF